MTSANSFLLAICSSVSLNPIFILANCQSKPGLLFLKGEKPLTDYKFEWIPDIKRSNYMVEIQYEKGMAFTDILRLAMKKEEKALALYNELQEKADVPEAKEIFKMLCQEEAKHKLTLETMYDDHMAEIGD